MFKLTPHSILCLLLFTSSCNKNTNCKDDSHSQIEFKNNSNLSVNLRVNEFDDTTWVENGSAPTDFRLTSPNSILKLGAGRSECWESYYVNNFHQYYFIFNQDTVQALGWQGISGTNRGQLKRIKVDLNYLQANNFTITYP